MNEGNELRRPISQKIRDREVVLNFLWDQYENGEIGFQKFLACANHASSGWNQSFVIRNQTGVTIVAAAPIHNRGNKLVIDRIEKHSCKLIFIM